MLVSKPSGNFSFEKAILVCLLALVTAGCGAAPEPSPTAAPEVPATPTPSPPPPTEIPPQEDAYAGVSPEGMEIALWHPWHLDSDPPIEELAAGFNTSNESDITIEVTGFQGYEALSAAIINAVQNGEALPDLALGYPYQYRAWQANGAPILDLTPLVASPSAGLAPEQISDFFPGIWAQDQYGEARYAFPMVQSGQVMLYNQTWANEIGFSAPPSTPQDFQAQACAPDSGGWLMDTSSAVVLNWLAVFGAQPETEDGYAFNTPEVGTAFTFLYDLYSLGCTQSAETQFPHEAFASREALFYTADLASLPHIYRAFAEAENSDFWVVIPFPGTQDAAVTTGPSFVFFQSTPESELAAWAFIQYLFETPQQMGWVRNFSYALQTSSHTLLSATDAVLPAWALAGDNLPASQSQPRHASWGVVQGVLSDAASQLFKPSYNPLTLPQLLQTLQDTADDLHAELSR